MTHSHLEIVLPPVPDVLAAVTDIMDPFCQVPSDDEPASRHAFWDFWVIGGRWSGEKLLARLGARRVQDFRAALAAERITVSGVAFGKPTLNPISQLSRVNEMWNEAFPDSPVKECPLFDFYKDNFGDVMPLKDVAPEFTCEHIIIAGPPPYGTRLEAAHMMQALVWNGVNFQRTTWSGGVSDAVADFIAKTEDRNVEWIKAHHPGPDWLVVTMDYHS